MWPGLGDGPAGLALLFAYHGLSAGGASRRSCIDHALACLDIAGEQATHLFDRPGLINGYVGIAWAVDHLENLGVLPSDEDLNEQVDLCLLETLEPNSWQGLPDLIGGLAGFGIYAVDRRGRGRSARILARVMDILESTAERPEGGAAWYDPPDRLYPEAREVFPEGLYNLGVSHGNPGISGFLAEALSLDERSGPLLDASMAWILRQGEDHPDGSRFGEGFPRGAARRNPGGSRLSWCYGDLGLSLVTLLAARKRGCTAWEREALDLGRACARRPTFLEGVRNGCLCHGAFGNAHMFNRLYQASGDLRFQEAALAMYAHGLSLGRDASSSSGFSAQAPNLSQEGSSPGILTGLAGIGLALIAATTDMEPLWDGHMLLHVPPLEY